MPYIGKTPLTGAYQLCDAIVTSATATYNLLVGGSAVIPGAAQNCIVSLNGVVQAPVGAYTVSGSTIVFASTLSATDVIDFILILGNVFDIGKPTDGSVTNASVSASAAIAYSKLNLGTSIVNADISASAAIAFTKLASTGTITLDNIQFPATAVPSANANNLDDYEEGTVTATMTPTTSGTIPLSASIQTLAYTKVGRLVTITGLLRTATPSSPVGAGIDINNLPFTISSSIATYGARGGGAIQFFDSSLSTRTAVPFQFSEGETKFTISKDASTIGDNDDFNISFSYFS